MVGALVLAIIGQRGPGSVMSGRAGAEAGGVLRRRHTRAGDARLRRRRRNRRSKKLVSW